MMCRYSMQLIFEGGRCYRLFINQAIFLTGWLAAGRESY